MRSVDSRKIERKLIDNRLRNPASAKPKKGCAYTTTRFTQNAIYPESNLKDRLPEMLSERPYKNIIVLTPSNNITNIQNMPTNEQNQLALETPLETIAIVKESLEGPPIHPEGSNC